MKKKNVYIGHRYVPIIEKDPWNKEKDYESLTVVQWEGTSYTSRKRVPAGVDISNEEYWAVTGNYNAQVENYRKEVVQYKDEIKEEVSQYKDEISEQYEQAEKNINQIAKTIHSLEINIKYPPSETGLIGATGDGVADDTQKIQAIINYVRDNGGGKIVIPNGVFRITTDLSLYSNITIEGNGSTSVFYKTNKGYMFRARGSKGNQLPIAQNVTRGNRTIRTVNSNDFNAGDLILIKSQRNALSVDGGEQWQLGGSTGGTSTAFYGEFAIITRKDTDTQFVISNGLVYPDYLTNNRSETDTKARDSTTVQKVNAIHDLIIKDITIKGDISGGVQFFNCYNCRTENIDFYIETDATTIFMEESYCCEDRYSRTFFDGAHNSADHYFRNAYKVTSSMNCGYIGSYCEFGTQPFDFNFRDGSIVTTFPYADSVKTLFSTQNGLTSHGGTYGMSVTNSHFLQCVNYGVSSRTRESLISNNIIQGANVDTTFSYGVVLYEGCATDSIVSNNQISGFNKGVSHLDGTSPEKFFKWMGTQIVGNVLKDVNRAFIFEMNDGNTFNGKSGVSITNNTVSYFSGQYAKGVTTNGVNDILIAYNTFNDPYGNANAGIYDDGEINGGSHELKVLYNDISFRPQVWSTSREQQTSLQFETANSYNANELNLGDNVSVSKFKMGSLSPRIDDLYSLGWSGGRYRSVFASSGTINTSDRNYKDEIGGIPDEWLDAWEQVEYVRYKFIKMIEEKGENARWHVGVIAQQIDEVFNNFGLDAKEIGLLCYDEWTDEETGETKSQWSIRPSECQFMESALMRRELKRLKGV